VRALIQRVESASVEINNVVHSQIGHGLLLLIGIEEADTAEDILWLSRKVAQLRVFDDESGVMNLSVKEMNGEILVVSQFTLHASTKKGNRPSYIRAARPELAIQIYEKFLLQLAGEIGRNVSSGIFGAMMKISLINDGPVTIWIDTKNKE
jgi:D-tyrosyl-tRNA(Tyr) deacylase